MHGPSLHSSTRKGRKVSYAGKPQGFDLDRFQLYTLPIRIPRPLHGLPVLIKGNIGTRDRMQTNGESPHAYNLNIILQSVKTLLNAKFVLKITTLDCITAFCALKKREMHVFTLC